MPAHSKFCQASGFLLSSGNEGAGKFSYRRIFRPVLTVTDFIVLMMALHAALCILKPKTVLGETGLYKYRYLVYGLWVALPALAGGLAFTNSAGAYVPSGALCYLPTRPFWYSLALAWIPRSLVFISIALIYVAIYLFVRHNFAQFHLSVHSSYDNSTTATPNTIGTCRSQLRIGAGTMISTPTPSMSQRTTARQSAEHIRRESSPPAWENYSFGTTSPVAKISTAGTVKTDLADITPTDSSITSGTTSDRREETYAITPALRSSEIPVDTSVSVMAPPPSGHLVYAYDNTLRLINSRHQPMETEVLRLRHREIRRQMRFLFIYPSVYLFLWTVPFIQHCLDYSESYANDPNFGLLCASTVILALQCTIDSMLLTMQEKPWRHGPGAAACDSPVTLWGSLTPWRKARDCFTAGTLTTGSGGESSSSFRQSLSVLESFDASKFFTLRASSGGGKGKSRSEMMADARTAKRRKQAETALAKERVNEQRLRRKMSLVRRQGRDRCWWEEEGKKRKDSVLLGINSDGAGVAAGFDSAGASRGRARTVIDTTSDELEEREDELVPSLA